MAVKVKTAEEKISLLRTEYVQGLSARFVEVNQAYVDILESQGQGKSIHALEVLSHTLCGSAGTFGFGDIAAFCKRIEDLCRLLEKDFTNSEIMNEVSKSLSQLEEAIISPKISEQTGLLEFSSATTIKYTPKLIYILGYDKAFCRDLQIKIEKHGFIVRQFHTLDAFFNALEQELPEAMIIDIIPDDDYSTNALKFFYERTTEHIPSIVISVSHDFESRLKSVRAKADAFLTKPFDTSDIINTLESLISDKHNEPYRVLIVNDVEVMSAYYRIVLERADMQCRITSRPDEILQTLSDFEPDLVLMDLHMQECRGDELAKLIHQEKTYIILPIVYLSSETNTKEQLSALKMAGDEFLTKPIRPSELTATVTARVRRYRQIKSLMIKDSLTGLLNHSCLKSMLDKECARSSRNNQAFCFAMVDMDDFKAINDTYGHAAGDIVLKNLSCLFKQRLRKTDVVGRYDGEVFGIIMPDTSLASAETFLNELLEEFRCLDIKVNQKTINATFSAGIAAYPDYTTTNEIYGAADKFLYDAKFAGRNQVIVYKASAKIAQANV